MKSSDGKEDSYAQCVRESIRLGGCTASRSIYVGAICAALQCHKVVAGILITNWCWAYLRIG